MQILKQANDLAMQGDYNGVFQLFEAELNIQPAERDHPVILQEKVSNYLKLHGRSAVNLFFTGQYATTFGMIRRHPTVLLLLETVFDIEVSDYKNIASLISKLDRTCTLLDVSTRHSLLMSLRGTLDILGRKSEARDIALYAFDLLDFVLNTPPQVYREEVISRIQQHLNAMPIDMASIELTLMIDVLKDLELQGDTPMLFESIFGIKVADYEDIGLLEDKIRKALQRFQQPHVGLYHLIGLIGMYTYEIKDEAWKALVIVEAYTGITANDFYDIDVLSLKWNHLKKQLHSDTSATFYRVIITVLEHAGRNPEIEIKNFVQADSGFRDEDFESADQVIAKLETRFTNLQDDTQAAYIYSTIDTLSSVGAQNQSAAIADAFMSRYPKFWDIPEEGDPALIHVIAVLTHWFRTFFHTEQEIVLQYCRQALVYLRAGFGQQGIRLEDRSRFIQDVTMFRQILLKTGYYWLDQRPPGTEADLACEILLWDTELSQRLLAERFILEQITYPGVTDSILPGKWACAEIEPLTVSTDPEALAACVLYEEDQWVSENNDSPEISTSDKAPEWIDDLKKVSGNAVSIEQIANAIGKDVLVIKMTFQYDSSLVWMAFISDGQTLQYAGRYRGQPEDYQTIQTLMQTHDFDTGTFWRTPELLQGGQQYLTRTTELYLASLASVLGLHTLQPILHPGLHLIIQADTPLNAIPFAHLQIGDRPLFMQVESVQQSLSLLLNLLQDSAIQHLETADKPVERIGVASWFHPSEKYNREAARRLHERHFELAAQYKMDCFALSDQPECTIQKIQNLLNYHRNFTVLSICGHGNSNKSGVRLKDTKMLWDGSGCNLSGVELLLMVSCSIGRINVNNKNLDVDGFCIQLAVCRAFNVVACRWQVHSFEASAFASEIITSYLNQKENTSNQPYLCATALNNARKKWYTQHGNDGLNTIAAFELYGIG